MDQFVSLPDLGMAYRKAKVDLYYSSHASILAIAEYENNLYENLLALQGRLNSSDDSWLEDLEFLGTWTLVSKGIDVNTSNNGIVYASPHEKWKYLCQQEKKKITAEFRLMAQVSIDFHVLSALWISKVGHRYDAVLSENAYGNRLRRKKDDTINTLSMGSFKPYLHPFRSWRDNGILAMRNTLEEDKRIVAITADVSSFYHELNPDFMLNKRFLNIIDLELTEDEIKLNRYFIKALKNWTDNTPLKKGLPVGLPASAIVANMALIELDRLIEEEVGAIYYGRYVDDIILVMEDGCGFNSPQDVWEWLFARSSNLLNWKDAKKEAISFHPEYLKDSKIIFANKKNKVFLLEGSTGLTMVDSLAKEIHERASEWRALPNLPKNADHIATDLVAAAQNDGERADNLRKTDDLSMRRAGFALKLRDFEAYERDLHPDAWVEHRHAFFNAFIQHVLVLPIFFDLAIYLPRIVRMATACEDFEYLQKIINTLAELEREVKDSCDLSIKSCSINPSNNVIFERWNQQLVQTIEESIKSAFPARLGKEGKKSWNKYFGNQPECLFFDCSFTTMKNEQIKLFSYDLTYKPFRYIGMPTEIAPYGKLPYKKTIQYCKNYEDFLLDSVIVGAGILSEWTKLNNGHNIPQAFLFPTRPFNITELYFLQNNPFSINHTQDISTIMLSLRGFTLADKLPIQNGKIIEVPKEENWDKINIALANWKTEDESWRASVMQHTDPDLTRYQRLMILINHLISHPENSRYFVMPELSLPARWFIPIARKLQNKNINFISGIEYLHRSRRLVSNQVWAALSSDAAGFPLMVVVQQDKQSPALHEEQELYRLAHLLMMPKSRWQNPPVIKHGDFFFSMLICSELTNIAYRTTLRGNIDALFVPEWNPDTETFNALVESSALDIHAYVIQCNDRKYGDSRIRAPYKKSWLRDNVRTKGGISDYIVIGQIDVEKLRAFQSSHRSPSDPFKPVSDGYEIAYDRKILPLDSNGNV